MPAQKQRAAVAYGTFPHQLLPPTPDSSLFSTDDAAFEDRELTEQEREEYERGLVTWDKAKSWRFWLRWRWIPWYLLLGLAMGAVACLSIYHREVRSTFGLDWETGTARRWTLWLPVTNYGYGRRNRGVARRLRPQVIKRLTPIVEELRQVKYGWLLAILGLVVLNFPPLMGSELLMVACGVVWGLKGGLIVAVGTVLGEMANFTVWSTCCSVRAEKFSRKSLNYACLRRVIDTGGLFPAWVIRMSALPTHATTVLFAVCGFPPFKFFLAILLSLPKQFVAVYLGVLLMRDDHTDTSRWLSRAVVTTSIVFTLLSFWYLQQSMIRVRKSVILDMRDSLARRGIDEPMPDTPITPAPATPDTSHFLLTPDTPRT